MKKIFTFILIACFFMLCNGVIAQNAQPSLSETTEWLTGKIMSYGLPYESEKDLDPFEIHATTSQFCNWEVKYKIKWSSVQPKISASYSSFTFVDKYATSYFRVCRNHKPTQEQAAELISQASWRQEDSYDLDIYNIPFNMLDRVDCNSVDQSITLYTKGNDIYRAGKQNKTDHVYIKFDFSREGNLKQRIQKAIENIIKLTASKEPF